MQAELFTSEESIPVRGLRCSHSFRGQEKVKRDGMDVESLNAFLVTPRKYLAKKQWLWKKQCCPFLRAGVKQTLENNAANATVFT